MQRPVILVAAIVSLWTCAPAVAEQFKDEYAYRGGRCRYEYKAEGGSVEEKWHCKYAGRARSRVEHKHDYPYSDGTCMHEFTADRGKVEEKFECRYRSGSARPRPRDMPQGSIGGPLPA